MNALQGQWENFWAAEPCNVVRLVTDDDVADKIAYVAANPVAAGLVMRPQEWPGFVAWEEKVFVATRPMEYFRKDGTCPAELTLAVEAPTLRDEERGTETWSDRIARRISSSVEAAHRAIRQAGRAFMGREAVLAASFAQRAASYEEKRWIIPTFAARLGFVRERLRQAERHFRARYRVALERWRSGRRDAVFPFGTWGMRVVHAALVDAPLGA
jgi:hypothetical protein